MNGNNTYFISDLHLGASYIPDRIAHERQIVEWLKSIEPDCKRLFLVGDILDYWYEYKHVVPQGFVRFFGQLAHMSDIGIEITWFIGNHDIWIFNYLPSELGITVIDGEKQQTIDGITFFIGHGDGVGNLKRSFRFLRSVFRNRLCQRLYSAIHPGLTIPFAHRWSASSREGQGRCSDQSCIDKIEYWAEEYSADHPEVSYIVLGHYHVMLDKKLKNKCRLIILGDWINKFSYAVFDGKELKLFKIDYICNTPKYQ